jgi:predicted HTH domain antitoxin
MNHPGAKRSNDNGVYYRRRSRIRQLKRFRAKTASLKLTPERFEAEARMLLAIKLYEQGRVTTGIAAQVAGIDRVTFMFELDK